MWVWTQRRGVGRRRGWGSGPREGWLQARLLKEVVLSLECTSESLERGRNSSPTPTRDSDLIGHLEAPQRVLVCAAKVETHWSREHELRLEEELGLSLEGHRRWPSRTGQVCTGDY